MTIISKVLSKFSFQNKELLLDSAFAFAIRIVAAFASFYMNMVVARNLGAHEAGNFFLSIAVITIMGTLLGMGANIQLLRYTGVYNADKNWNHVAYIVWIIIKKVLLFSIPATVILLLLNNFIAHKIFFKEDLDTSLFWIFLTLPIYIVTTLLAFSFQGIKKILLSISLQSVFVPIALSIGILINKTRDASIAAETYFFVSLGTLFIGIFAWAKFVIRRKKKEEDIPHLPSFFWKSMMTLWMFNILQTGIQWGGQLIAGMHSSPEDLAQLAVAQRTSMLISFILIAVNLVSAPKFASMYSQGKLDELRRYSINTTRLMTVFATPLILAILFFPGEIMQIFGKGFYQGTEMLRILAIGQYINVLTGSVAYLLMMSGHEKELKNITIISGIVSIILNVILVKYYSVMGAAIAIAISISLQNLLAVKMVNKKLGFNTLAIW
jgi:O-antigen/teichoic acid export membrane protein